MKYRKKPIIVETIQWKENNFDEIEECFEHSDFIKQSKNFPELLLILTLEGVASAYKNDYIIKGIKGEFYPVKEEIFNMSYEAVEE